MKADEVPNEVVEERSGVHFVPVARANGRTPGGERFWKWAALILSTLLTAGALAGGFGRALFVTRNEYTDRTQSDAVARENMRGTLERLDRTLNAQADAFRVMTDEVQGLKINLAILQKKR
jgi:hypothetical protein